MKTTPSLYQPPLFSQNENRNPLSSPDAFALPTAGKPDALHRKTAKKNKPSLPRLETRNLSVDPSYYKLHTPNVAWVQAVYLKDGIDLQYERIDSDDEIHCDHPWFLHKARSDKDIEAECRIISAVEKQHGRVATPRPNLQPEDIFDFDAYFNTSTSSTGTSVSNGKRRSSDGMEPPCRKRMKLEDME